MKEIQTIKYEAEDGTKFDTARECRDHERFLDMCERLEDIWCRGIDKEDVVRWIIANCQTVTREKLVALVKRGHSAACLQATGYVPEITDGYAERLVDEVFE